MTKTTNSIPLRLLALAAFGAGVHLTALLSPAAAESPDRAALRLFHEGKVTEAEATMLRALDAARSSGKREREWQLLHQIGWFYDEIGQPKRSLGYSEQSLRLALDLAGRLPQSASAERRPNDGRLRFMVSRSLAWIGFSLSAMGLYEAALDFYRRAREESLLNGKVDIVPAWGLATQEMGNIQFKMGDVDKGKAQVEEALALARQAGVDLGISECTAILTEIALHRGELDAARQLADESLRTAERSNDNDYTSLLGIGNAKLVRAKVAARDARSDPAARPDAATKLSEALAYAESHDLARIRAEALLLQSDLLPPDALDERLAKVTEALRLLEKNGSELRGDAHTAVGRVLLDQEKDELAERYLKMGIDLDKTLLRRVHRTFAEGALATLEGVRGDTRAGLERREQAAREARSMGLTDKAAEEEQRLAEELADLGYAALAEAWIDRAVESLDLLLQRSPARAERESLIARKVSLLRRKGAGQVLLQPGGGGA